MSPAVPSKPAPSESGRIRGWLCDHALPRWAEAQTGFAECLMPDGTPDKDAPRRIVVQARQLYVYSHAAVLGLMPQAAHVAELGFHNLLCHGAPDGLAKGFVHALDGNGNVLDSGRDLYDHAFLLLAFSWYLRATDDPKSAQAIKAVAAVIADLRHPSGIGYRENSGGSLPRTQNSHMHLLESFLAAHAATGGGNYLEQAGAMAGLLPRFLNGSGLLLEFFDDALRPALHPAGPLVEPGHHHEWVWLLGLYAKASGHGQNEVMHGLYEAARSGTEAKSGLIYNELSTDGRIKDAGKRLWPQTELLKAELALGLPGEASVARIFHHFLEPAPSGAWIERLDGNNAPLPAAIPASSFYHLFLAFTEYLSVQTP
jgi:mannose/cellobiose epimerase-like protein (N-acyl-D-glucosamine 2-epimerase family)